MNKLKPINTVFSVDSILNIKELVDAKVLMNTKYGNKYSHIPPHLAYTIMPFPEESLKQGIKDLTEYIKKQKPFKVRIANLEFEEKDKFFFVDIQGDKIRKHHENITTMLNKYRNDFLREKDLVRFENGDFDSIEKDNLERYGNARVFSKFKTHVTIGNFTVPDVNTSELKDKLAKILQPILNKDVIIDNIHGVFHTDSAKSQSEMKQMWDKVFKLQ